ncbi:hypothetical protein OEZ86_013361 [Tetradesmus obliquus]|nr:hypothetical protein OEZ86_013361 [Tetradesmus obliquus]
MGSEAAQQGSHAARFPDQPITQQHVQQAQQQNHSQAQQQLEPAQQQSLDYLLDIISQVAKDDPTGVFEYPVDGALVPGYYDKIRQPMCFSSMRSKLAAREYRTWREFAKDLDLIFENAKTFNPSQHRIHKLAINMQRNARKLLQTAELPARRCIHLLHPAGPKAAAAEEEAQILYAAQPMDVEPQQQQQQQQQQPLSTAAAAALADVEPASIFSSLELVEQQIVAARLLLSRAYGIEVSLSPAGVRLGQYTAARLLGDGSAAGAAAAVAGGRGGSAAGASKRAAAAAGLSRGGSGMLGGGMRGLQREGSVAGSMKKRRVERSGIAGIGGVVEDDGVLSPSASLPARLMERAVTSIHIPSVREIPPEEWAAVQAAATSWRAAVKAHGQRQGLAKPPPEVRRVLAELAERNGSSDEDSSDEAYAKLHAPLEEDEHIRLNGPAGGGRKRNKNKTKQTGGSSKQQQQPQSQQQQQPESPFSKQQRELLDGSAAAAAAAAGPERGSSPAAAAAAPPAKVAAAAAAAPARAASIATAAGPGSGGPSARSSSMSAPRPGSSFELPILTNSLNQEVFVKGVGTHMWQSSGDESSNWSHILRSWGLLNYPRFAMARLLGGFTVLERCPNSWDRYEEDAALSSSLGCNGFRLSLEWSRIEPRRGFIDQAAVQRRIEPRRGFIDQAAVQRYRDIFAALLRRGMTPNATLHHFTHPQWFDELGGFTKAENIQIFVDFAVKAVQLFGNQCQLWATFNEPTSSSTMGFIFGAYPPGQMLGLETAGRALLNMLRAHTAAYRAIKALPGGERHKVGLTHMVIPSSSVGLTHMVIPFSHWPDLGPLTAHSRFAARWLTFWWGYDLMHEYLQSGKFAWCVPSLGSGGSSCSFVVQDGRPPLDWFGVNFYSRPVISPFLSPGRLPWQVISDLGYPIDPQGMYEVLVRCSAYGVPLYVTETGVSINSQRHRQYMVDSYLKEILRAMTDGVDVRGLYYWTLLDNFEWNGGYSIKFGLYEWSPWPWGGDRRKRSAADTLAGFYHSLPPTVAAVRKWARHADLSHEQHSPPPHSLRWVRVCTAGCDHSATVGPYEKT